MNRIHGLAIVASALLGLMACDSAPKRNEPGTTYGQIYVGAPRITTRERLINDRLEQDEWLRAWLAKADTLKQDISGKTDIRSLSSNKIQLAAQTSPALRGDIIQQNRLNNINNQNAALDGTLLAIQQAGAQSVLDKLSKGEIKADEAKTELAKLGLSFPSYSTPTTPSSLSSIATQQAALSSFSGVITATTPTPTALTADLSSSPLEYFREQLALREEIRTEIIDNALDDAHDLGNNTLLRLTFDATVLPGNDSGAWGVVQVRLHDGAVRPTLVNKAYLELEEQADGFLRKLRESLCLEIAPDKPWKCGEDAIQDKAKNDERINKVRQALRNVGAFEFTGHLLRIFNRNLYSNKATFAGTDSGNPDLTRVLIEAYALKFDKEYGCYLELRNKHRKNFLPNFWEPRNQDQRKSSIASTAYVVPDSITELSVGMFNWKTADLQSTDHLREKAIACGFSSIDDAAAKVDAALQNTYPSTTQKLAVYSVTPKETVQLISEVASRRAATEFALGLNAIAPGGNVGAMLAFTRANEAFNQAVRRQPLVVGFTDSPQTGASPAINFGWVLGPTFNIDDKGHASRFRHIPRQQALSAVISVPKHWRTATFTVTPQWFDERSGYPASSIGAKSFTIALPVLSSSPVAQLRLRTNEIDLRQPLVIEPISTTVEEGKSATLMLRGHDLWRSTEVYIGNQKADSVRVLPDMRGVVAHFTSMSSLRGSESGARGYPITVHTSEGSAVAGHARMITSGAQRGAFQYSLASPRLEGSTQTFSIYVQPAMPNYAKLEYVVRRSVASSITQTIGVLSMSPDGRIASGVLKETFSNGDLLELWVRSQSSPQQLEQNTLVTRNWVYYATAEDAKIKVTPNTTVTLPTMLTLTMPERSAQAFADLSQQPIRLIAKAQLSSGTQSLNPVPLDKACTYGMSVCSFRIPAEKAWTAKQLKELAAGGTLELSLQGNPDIKLSTTSIPLAKK